MLRRYRLKFAYKRKKSSVSIDTLQFSLVEIKLGGDQLIEQGATTLKTLAAKIDTDKMKAPSFLMVLTATGKFAYRREDGVYVVPLGCLKD